MAVADRLDADPERLWVGVVLALAAALAGGSVALPRLVYDRFLWQYFWGPVQADANSAVCAVRAEGATRYLGDAAACSAAAGPVAYPGYTLVSEVGYVLVLLLALSGLVFLLRRLDVGGDRRFLFALVPFVFLGGALRVVEDATDTAGGADALVSYPLNTLIISPVIYFTVFGLTLAAVVVAVGAERRGLVADYAPPLAGLGVAALVGVGGLLTAVAGTTFHPQVLGVVAVLATASAAATVWVARRIAPWIDGGTGRAGHLVVWGHAVDGAANVVALDWMPALGAGPNLVPKHPVNRAIVEVTGATLPGPVLAVTGDAWPFLLVKLVAAAVVVAVFDEQVYVESPRYTVLLLIAVLAVGLGPGTRDVLRATLGV
jgi:uncharacterized membrane protein